MSLQSLEWRKLPTRVFPIGLNPTASYFMNTIYDVLTGSLYHDGSARILGSGSAWQMPSKFVTGSNTEAVYVFPSYQTNFSQSVIFAAKSTTGAVSSGTPININGTRTGTQGAGPFTFATNLNVVYGALVKNASASFVEWTGRNPFGSGSYSMGYASMMPFPAQLDKLTVYESKEAIATVVQHNVYGTCIFIAGAIIDPEQSGVISSLDAETDGRIYGTIMSGRQNDGHYSDAQGISSPAVISTFLTNADRRYAFSAGNDGNSSNSNGSGDYTRASKFVIFEPNSNSFLNANTEKFKVNTFATSNPIDTTIETPLRCYSDVSSSFLGRIREIVAIKNTQSSLVVRDNSNNILGYTIGASENSSGNAVLLKYS